MIKYIELESGDQSISFEERENYYRLKIVYLEDVGSYYTHVWINNKYAVTNALRPFQNIFRQVEDDIIKWIGLYDTYIDRPDRALWKNNSIDNELELGKRYKLLYVTGEEESQIEVFNDMSQNGVSYYE